MHSKGRYPIQHSEAYQLAMHTLGQYRGTIIACRYCPPPSFRRPEALKTLRRGLYDAIARVVLSQPHLQVDATGENSESPACYELVMRNGSLYMSRGPTHIYGCKHQYA